MIFQPIPRIFHFIWFGPKPMPEESRRNIESWKALHPHWSLMLWNLKSADEFMLRHGETAGRRLFYNQRSFASKSDIFRLILLKHIGGVYLDGDMEPVREINPIIDALNYNDKPEKPSCLIGYEQDGKRLNNAMLASGPMSGPVCDALDNLPIHLANPSTNKEDAAFATGPFYLTSIWLKDSRVGKLPRVMFYPYDWHEPWRASEKWGHETIAVHRWDASWVDETTPEPILLDSKIAVQVIGDFNNEPELAASLAWGSHLGQSVSGASIIYPPAVVPSMPSNVGDFAEPILRNLKRMTKSANRIIFVPASHVLDRNFVLAHSLLPVDCLGVSWHRFYSSERLFSLEQHRKAKAFPFDVFAAHGVPTPFQRGGGATVQIRGGCNDVREAFSMPCRAAIEALESMDNENLAWPFFASLFVEKARCIRSLRVAFTYLTATTKLCRHPVAEPQTEKTPSIL